MPKIQLLIIQMNNSCLLVIRGLWTALSCLGGDSNLFLFKIRLCNKSKSVSNTGWLLGMKGAYPCCNANVAAWGKGRKVISSEGLEPWATDRVD